MTMNTLGEVVRQRVKWHDGQRHKWMTGTVRGFGKSCQHPWNVYLIQTDGGYGNLFALPNGEVIQGIEVHPDRAVPLGA